MTTATLDYGYYGGLLPIGSEFEKADRENYTEGNCYLLAKVPPLKPLVP